MDKNCGNCKWLVQPKAFERRFLCGNPLNDFFYNYFNASTGETITDIRRAMEIGVDDECNAWEKKKAK